VRLVAQLANVSEDRAAALLEQADGRVKVAAIMGRTGLSAQEAQGRLDAADGSLRQTLRQAQGDR